MEINRKIFIILVIYGFLLFFIGLFLNKIIIWDEYFFLIINGLSNPYLGLFFNLITYLGSSVFWIFLIVIFWLKNNRKLSLHLLFAFIIDSFFLVIFKWIFLRPRPLEVIEFDVGPSFPSGHSERVFSGAIVLSKYYKKYRILFYTLATLVSFSRIYIGVHYPLDVIIGSINGIIIGMIALAIPTKRIEKRL